MASSQQMVENVEQVGQSVGNVGKGQLVLILILSQLGSYQLNQLLG